MASFCVTAVVPATWPGGNGATIFLACKMGLERIVSRRLSGSYIAGLDHVYRGHLGARIEGARHAYDPLLLSNTTF
jgi:hypothetical protein